MNVLLKKIISKAFKIKVCGDTNLEQKLLLIGNHISLYDYLFMQVSTIKKILFLVRLDTYEKLSKKWFFRFLDLLCIDEKSEQECGEIIQKKLSCHFVLCFFAEKEITSNGQIHQLSSNFEPIAAKIPELKIVPFYFSGTWETPFSQACKKTKNIKPPIFLFFGKALPNETTHKQIYDALIDLSVFAFEHRVSKTTGISNYWFDSIKKNQKFFIADSTGVYLKGRKILVGVLVLAGFLKDKLQNEKNVATILPSSAAGCLCNVALSSLGKTICNLNYTAGSVALEHAISLSKINTIITSQKFLEILKEKGFDLTQVLSSSHLIYLEDAKKSATVLTKIKLLLISFLPVSLLKNLYSVQKNPDDTAFILFSSGSENLPKGIEITHKNIIGNVLQAANLLDADYDDVLVGTLPIFHSFGLTICVMLPQLTGLSTIYHPDPTDGVNIANLTQKYKGSLFFSTPTFLRLYTKNNKINPNDFKTFNKVITGAEKLSSKVRSEFESKFGVHIYEGYGVTETSPVISCNTPSQSLIDKDNYQISNKVGTVGQAIVGTKIKIIDPKTHKPLKTGEEGMICVAGVQLMKGYLHDDELTKKVMVKFNGMNFYMTGDKGKIDDEGFVTIVDRYSRFAKIGGEMISLSSLEVEINQYTQESEICATKLRDDKKGEKIVLLYSGEMDIDDVRQKLLKNKINPLYIPSVFIQVDDIPKLGTGKVSFADVKKLAMRMLSEKP